MKVLITGGSGFVGSHLLKRLNNAGIRTVALLRNRSTCLWLPQTVEVIEAALEDFSKMVKLIPSDITHVVHCAGVVAAAHKEDFYRVNRDGTENLIKALTAKVKNFRFIYVSSLAAAGPNLTEESIREDVTPSPVSEYGKSKYAGEQVVCSQVPEWLIIRPCAIYGPRDKGFLPIFRVIKCGIVPVRRYPFWFSVIYVKDLVEIILHLLTCPPTLNQVLNIADPVPVEFSQFVRLIQSTLAPKFSIKIPVPNLLLKILGRMATISAVVLDKPLIMAHGKVRELMVKRWVANTNRLQSLLPSYFRFTPLNVGISQTVEWYLQNGWI